MQVISVRESPEYKDRAITYFQSKEKSVLLHIYDDCIRHSVASTNPLPQWYLLLKDHKPIGYAGLITNDFISRMDLYPWICVLFVEARYRGNHYGSLLINSAKRDAGKAKFEHVYLCTDHIGYDEKYGFSYIGQGFHPWGGASRIYQCKI